MLPRVARRLSPRNCRRTLPALPFYVGEFGLDVQAPSDWHRTDGVHADGAEWLRAVRSFARVRGNRST